MKTASERVRKLLLYQEYITFCLKRELGVEPKEKEVVVDGKCKICGQEDLMTTVTGDGACAVCQMKYVAGYGPMGPRIATARATLGLKDGEYLKQDNAEEARKILGR